MIPWQDIFSKQPLPISPLMAGGGVNLRDLTELKSFLDAVHIRYCLVKPFQEMENYPLVEARELLPSFDSDMCEYPELPGFALVAFGRPLNYFSEIFQYDQLHTVPPHNENLSCPLENQVILQNLQVLASRLPKKMHDQLRNSFKHTDPTLMENYCALLPYLLEMDRAHVFALDSDKLFHLAGVFASFPSDFDNILKNFGLGIGKFKNGDNQMYERNRMFVYQFFMELYGFPIVSERRTSSAMFARRLQGQGENFILRVLGQTDRTLTTYTSSSGTRRYPSVEKIALVAVDSAQKEAIETIDRKGFFLDARRRAVIIRIRYRQHNYDARNLRQDRALSVISQEILHPLTGEALRGLNIIKDATNILLSLNDIVRGEYTGRMHYKHTEIVENTDTDEKRLKCIYCWLDKNQRRMIGYSDKFFNDAHKVMDSYLQSPERAPVFDALRELYQEVYASISYIRQARRVRVLQDIASRSGSGKRLSYKQMVQQVVALLNEIQFEIVNFFPEIVEAVVKNVEKILHDSYLRRAYIEPPESSLTRAGQEIRKNYGRMVALLDSIKAVRKARLSSEGKQPGEAIVA